MKFCFTSLLSLLLATTPALAQVRESEPDTSRGDREKGDFSAELRAGLEYDSNVSVEEVDQSSGRGDYAAVFDGQLEYKSKLGKQAGLSLGYDFSQSFYDEFSFLDRQTHMFSAGIDGDFQKADPGLDYRYIHSRLDGDKFLTMHQLSPSLAGFVAKKWYWRGAYTYSDKQIEQRPQRDATYHAGNLDIYYFISGLRSYVNLGYRYKDEDAKSSEFDYRAHRIKLRYIRRFDFLTRQAKLSLSLRYTDRDYSSVTSSIDEEREDERYRASAELELPLTERAALSIYYTYGDNQSNLPSADYDQQIVGSQFLYRWN